MTGLAFPIEAVLRGGWNGDLKAKGDARSIPAMLTIWTLIVGEGMPLGSPPQYPEPIPCLPYCLRESGKALNYCLCAMKSIFMCWVPKYSAV